ncbi:MAG: molecular chaperone TorD family protein [Deltaproteobacteria bacterium]|nr:molecular chaperone TorD family protein [Deltaproteobacteria bacterium]
MGTSGESAIVGSGAEERRAAARSSIYGLFQDALTYPDDEVREGLATGELVELMRKGLALAEVDFTPAQEWWRALQEVGGTEDLAVEYTRLFDAGASGPPCPLYGGLYGGDRMKKMEEAVRFYNHFGLTTSEEQRELPDHLAPIARPRPSTPDAIPGPTAGPNGISSRAISTVGYRSSASASKSTKRTFSSCRSSSSSPISWPGTSAS